MHSSINVAMAVPYPDTTEALAIDFPNYHDFGFMDSTSYDQVLALHTSFYNNNGSFETHGSCSDSQPSASQYQTCNLQDPVLTGQMGSVTDTIGNWASNVNMNSSMFAPSGANSGVSPYGSYFKEQDCRISIPRHVEHAQQQLQDEQHAFDMGWNSQPLHGQKPLSTSPTSSMVMVGNYSTYHQPRVQQQEDMETCSTSHTDNRLAAATAVDIQKGSRRPLSGLGVTESVIQRGEHRRQMSCLNVAEDDMQRSLRGHRRGLVDTMHQQLPGAFTQMGYNEFPVKQEEFERKDVSSMLMDMETRLIANLSTSSPQRAPLEQQNIHSGIVPHPHTGSWEESMSSDSMLSSSPSGKLSVIDGHCQTQSGMQFRGPPAGPSGLQPSLGYANQQERGVSLVNSLIGCADAVANKKQDKAKSLLNELSHMVSPYGDSMERVASYFTYGLVSHIACTGSGSSLYRALGIKEPTAADTLDAFHVFSRICPFMKFGEVAASQTILEAFQGEEDVHWIDLGMVQGSQWLSYQLLQGLATRSGGPPKSIHVTGVQINLSPRSPVSLTSDDQTTRQLKEFAESLRLNFLFHPVSVERLEHLQPWMLATRSGQAVAVNCSARMHTLLYDEGNCLNHILSIIHGLRPKILCILEQEASHNAPFFLARFLEALHFYSAMFDSLDATLTRISAERAKVEQLWLGQEIINIVSCEGIDRIERHERSQQWRSRMAKAGYRPVPLSETAITQVKNLHCLSYGTTGFTVVEDRGSLILVWQDRPLFSSSVWTC